MLSNITVEVIAGCVVVGIILGITIEVLNRASIVEYTNIPVAEAAPVGKEVRIEVRVDWTRERIEQEIRTVFPNDPDVAVRIAHCESGLDADIQSHHQLSYGRERSFGVFQLHEPDWGKKAIALGFDKWKTNPADNIAMARYIYEQSGNKWSAWTCYNKKMY